MDNKNILISFLICVLLFLFIYSTKELFDSNCPQKPIIQIYAPTIQFTKIDNKEFNNYLTEPLAQNFVRVYNDVSKEEKRSLGSFDKSSVYSNMQMYYKHMNDLMACYKCNEDKKEHCITTKTTGIIDCKTKSEPELIEFMDNDIKELEFILKNKKITDTDIKSKMRVGVIITTMINKNNYDKNALNILFIPCFYDFNNGQSILKLKIEENKTYYVIELYKLDKKNNIYIKTIKNIDYSQLPLNWYNLFENYTKKINGLNKKLDEKKNLDTLINKENDTEMKHMKNLKLKKKIIEENAEFLEKKKLQKEIESLYLSIKELNEKNYYKDPKVLRFKKFKSNRPVSVRDLSGSGKYLVASRKKIPAELFPEVFLNSYLDATITDKVDNKRNELISSQLVVSYKNIVERQIKHLIDENKDRIENVMKIIKQKEDALEVPININIGVKVKKTYKEFNKLIKDYNNEYNNINNKRIEKIKVNCSEKARIKKIINNLKKEVLKLRKYTKKVDIHKLLDDDRNLETIEILDMGLVKTTNFKEYNIEKEIFYKDTKHDEIPITTPSTTMNSLSQLKSKQNNEKSYLDSFEDSFI